MFDSTFLTTHATHLIEEHIEEAFLRRCVLIRIIVPLDETSVNNKAVLIKHRLQSINDAIFFPDISSYLFDVNVLFGLDQVFFEQLRNDAVTKVSLNYKF